MNHPHHTTIIVQPSASNGLGTAGFVISIVGFFTCGLLCPLGFLLSLGGLLKAPRGLALAGVILGFIGSTWLWLFGFAMIVGIVGIGGAAAQIDREMTAKMEPEKHDIVRTHPRELPSRVEEGSSSLPAKETKRPYTIAEIKELPITHQKCIQVSCPRGTKLATLEIWQKEILATYASDETRPFINFYDGEYHAGNADNMIATDEGLHELLWVGDAPPTTGKTELMPSPAVPASAPFDASTIVIPPEEMAARTRTFTTTDGKFSVEAMFLTMRDDVAYLQKTSTSAIVEVPIEKLSNSDRIWIRRIAANDKKTSSAKE